MKRILLIFLNFLALEAAVSASPEFVSASVGRVGEHYVTSREVQIGQLVEATLYKSDKTKGNKIIGVRDRHFPREVSNYLLEYVVYLESKGFSAAKVSSKELSLSLDEVRAGMTNSKDWKSLEVSASELRDVVTRKLQAKRFIRFRVDSSAIPITDEEAERYFNDNQVKFGNVPFDSFKDNIKAFLARRQVDQRLKDWFEILQTKYRVRNFLTEP